MWDNPRLLNGAASVAAYLGNLRVAESHPVMPITRSDHIVDFGLKYLRVSKRLGKSILGCGDNVGASINQCATNDPR